jgi:putative methyltransferase (TIGR04325 family)
MTGYDHDHVARSYENNSSDSALSYDYPMMFWLSRILHHESRVFDFGGNLGTHFYVYNRYLRFPLGVRWTVCEVPSIAAAGARLARLRNAGQLRFTTDYEALDGCDILLASGSLQYLEKPTLPEILSGLTQAPRHLLLNRIPLYDGEPYVTLQNGGQTYYPQLVANRAAFVQACRDLSYSVVDCWKDHVDSCIVPFHPERSINHLTGMYMSRTELVSYGNAR